MSVSAAEMASLRSLPSEGFKAHKYLDTRGNESIGFGFNIDSGISLYAAKALNLAQMEERQVSIQAFWWAKDLDAIRLSVLVEVAFNDGVVGLLHFPKMLTAIGAKDWPTAAAELLDSDAGRELVGRYTVLARILESGVNA